MEFKIKETLFLAVIAVFLGGCGSGDPYALVSASGKVTYDDGTPIPVPSMRLIFDSQEPPIDDKTYPRKGVADVGADGTFENVTTYKYGDGLIAGKHKVTVIASEGQVRGAEQISRKVPRSYANGSTTPVVVDTDEMPLHIKIRKP